MKNKIVDNLTITDFEVYEDGIFQEIEAMSGIHAREGT